MTGSRGFLATSLKVSASTPREEGEKGQATPKDRLTFLTQKFDGHHHQPGLFGLPKTLLEKARNGVDVP